MPYRGCSLPHKTLRIVIGIAPGKTQREQKRLFGILENTIYSRALDRAPSWSDYPKSLLPSLGALTFLIQQAPRDSRSEHRYSKLKMLLKTTQP